LLKYASILSAIIILSEVAVSWADSRLSFDGVLTDALSDTVMFFVLFLTGLPLALADEAPPPEALPDSVLASGELFRARVEVVSLPDLVLDFNGMLKP
jgi:hypothetical protein